MTKTYAEIAVDVPLFTTFTYTVPVTLSAQIHRGALVLVPFGKKNVVGICLRTQLTRDDSDEKWKEAQLKDILAVNSQWQLSEIYLQWLEFAARYYFTPLGQVLAQALPAACFDVKNFNTPAKTRKVKTPAQTVAITPCVESQITLTPAQIEIVTKITSHLNTYAPHLIHGITGSGKTEIYIELIKKVLAEGRSALYLVPEIGLTPQTLARLQKPFGNTLLVSHSGLTPKKRLFTWQKATQKKPQVLIGTRSALFTSFDNLGLIVVDEEHDSSYKQEDRFRYHARDLAIARARFEKIPIILGSATPSLESYYHSIRGQYHYSQLTERAGESVLPKITLVDVAKEKSQTQSPLIVSKNLIQNLAKHFANGEQAIVFVGQRGFAQNAFCPDCQAVESCQNCSVGLKYHAPLSLLKCHYCSFHKPFDGICAKCQKKTLTLLGIGIQSVEAELKIEFPKAKIARVDSDTCSSAKKLAEILRQFVNHDIDMIVGTQMMAKGHDFAGLGFVGIIGIDTNLGLPDFRAAERSFQTLVQVAGRAGRRQKQGQVLVQTYMPEHASIQYGLKHDFENFARFELSNRETLHYPPFYRLAQIRFISNVEATLRDFMKTEKSFFINLRTQLSKNHIELLGPSEMPLAKLRGKYRQHLIVKIPRRLSSFDVLSYVIQDLGKKLPKNIHMQIDVDPMNLM